MAEPNQSSFPPQSLSSPEARSITLPSGKVVTLRKGKGRDLMHAQRAVAGNNDPTAVEFALIAELTQIDGTPIVYEDVLGMDLDDVLVLRAEVSSVNFPEPAAPSLAPAASQGSSTSASASGN